MSHRFYYNNIVRFTRDQIVLKICNEYDLFNLFWGKMEIKSPLETEILSGDNFYDILYYYSDPCNMAISERFKNLLITNNISGWKCYDIKIKNHDDSYFGFSVTGRCGDLIRPLNKGNVHGFEFDINTWDGSDFFCPEGFGFLFYSEKVKELIRKNNIRRVKLEKIESVEWYSAGGVFKKN
jgi:hypothetical protein